MTPRERLKQDLNTVHMPPGTRMKIAAAMRKASSRRVPMRMIAITAAMLLFFGMGAGAMLMYQHFTSPDTPAGPAAEVPKPLPTPESTPEPEPIPPPETMLALVTPGQYTDTVGLIARDDAVGVEVRLGGDRSLLLSKRYFYNGGEKDPDRPPVWFSADFDGDGVDEIVVCIYRRMYNTVAYAEDPRAELQNEGPIYMGVDVHVLKVMPADEPGETEMLVEILTILDHGSPLRGFKTDDPVFAFPKQDDYFGIEGAQAHEEGLWISGTCLDATLDEFEGKPALKIHHIPRQALPYSLIVWDEQAPGRGAGNWTWAVARQYHEPRSNLPGQGRRQEMDTGTVWWQVSPTPLYGSSELSLCEAHGFYNAEGVTIDPYLGPIGMEYGHGGRNVIWLYDPALDEIAYYYSSDSGSGINRFAPGEFASLYPEYMDRACVVFEADFEQFTYTDDNILDISEAFTGRCGVLYGDRFVTDFIFDYLQFPRSYYSVATDLAVLSQNGKWGVIDKTGRIVVPFELDHIMPINNETVFGRYNGLYGVIDVTRCSVR